MATEKSIFELESEDITSLRCLPVKTLKDKLSYIIGMNQGMELKQQGMDVDAAMIFKGLSDGLAGKKPLLMRVLGAVFSMEKFLGPDFEKGLSRLKTVSERADPDEQPA